MGSRAAPVSMRCLLVRLPNIKIHRRVLKYHDIRQLVAGCRLGRIGEGEARSWAPAAGSEALLMLRRGPKPLLNYTVPGRLWWITEAWSIYR